MATIQDFESHKSKLASAMSEASVSSVTVEGFTITLVGERPTVVGRGLSGDDAWALFWSAVHPADVQRTIKYASAAVPTDIPDRQLTAWNAWREPVSDDKKWVPRPPVRNKLGG